MGFPPNHVPVTKFGEPNFDSAELKMVKFDESYATTSYDARKRKPFIYEHGYCMTICSH